MARKTRVEFVDDIDGSEATETVALALDGVDYEIDLNEANAQQLREDLGTWIKAARRVAGRRKRGTAPSSGEGTSDAAKVRAWAKENGYTLNERGRIPVEVRQAYDAAA